MSLYYIQWIDPEGTDLSWFIRANDENEAIRLFVENVNDWHDLKEDPEPYRAVRMSVQKKSNTDAVIFSLPDPEGEPAILEWDFRNAVYAEIA